MSIVSGVIAGLSIYIVIRSLHGSDVYSTWESWLLLAAWALTIIISKANHKA
jgi:hypothetical protein